VARCCTKVAALNSRELCTADSDMMSEATGTGTATAGRSASSVGSQLAWQGQQ
jgi:hypothetical protein